MLVERPVLDLKKKKRKNFEILSTSYRCTQIFVLYENYTICKGKIKASDDEEYIKD